MLKPANRIKGKRVLFFVRRICFSIYDYFTYKKTGCRFDNLFLVIVISFAEYRSAYAYHIASGLHAELPVAAHTDRKSTRLNSSHP